MDFERTVFARRFVQLQARFEHKRTREKKIPFYFPEKENTRKESEKGDPEGKRPKGTSPPGKSNKPVCFHFQEGQCQK